ncbi:MAG: hypothetical protein C7B46_15435 [Sulfobacillus benefaciens]|uniref:Uncharacterized protein n=1 Tax=Sulfobacillus benefaciens TaxID=453960 RepID=A0A2T2XCN1_9FIRM|nr:MAG: hypothetical protein C7B46_15435 [Sulfobacillus benefaciens]
MMDLSRHGELSLIFVLCVLMGMTGALGWAAYWITPQHFATAVPIAAGFLLGSVFFGLLRQRSGNLLAQMAFAMILIFLVQKLRRLDPLALLSQWALHHAAFSWDLIWGLRGGLVLLAGALWAVFLRQFWPLIAHRP